MASLDGNYKILVSALVIIGGSAAHNDRGWSIGARVLNQALKEDALDDSYVCNRKPRCKIDVPDSVRFYTSGHIEHGSLNKDQHPGCSHAAKVLVTNTDPMSISAVCLCCT